ncbi:hypothetical protein BER93_04460 [Xanthomonas fragariae]|nr:hypothetical protein BER92_04460 [Xanthomonas fragariae]AOD17497.1 hypothetical protein BER93_04460 [Xanthomonas fragariae]
MADGIAYRDAGGGNQCLQRLACWWVLKVIDDVRFDAYVADQGQGVAGGAASGVVVDNGVHG